MTVQSDDVVDLIIEAWRERLPSIDDMQAAPDDLIAAEFPVRIIDVHLILSRLALMEGLHKRAVSVFGSELARISPHGELARAHVIRSFATNVVDSILCAPAPVSRGNLIDSVVARTRLLPLAPVERVTPQ